MHVVFDFYFYLDLACDRPLARGSDEHQRDTVSHGTYTPTRHMWSGSSLFRPSWPFASTRNE